MLKSYRLRQPCGYSGSFLMAAPGFGQVLRSHFDTILAGLSSNTHAGPTLQPG
jgi:hypothetical protein